MAADYSTFHDASAQDPPGEAATVTPSDSADLASVTTALWIGATGSGNLTVTMAGGQKVQFKGIASGTWLWLRVARVWSTGTDVTEIVALWREN